MAYKTRVTQKRFISKVERLIGRYLVTLISGRQCSFSYDRLTKLQDTRLFAMSQPIPQRQSIKSSPDSGRRHNRNYNAAADVAQRTVLVSAGNGKESKLAVVEVAR